MNRQCIIREAVYDREGAFAGYGPVCVNDTKDVIVFNSIASAKRHIAFQKRQEKAGLMFGFTSKFNIITVSIQEV